MISGLHAVTLISPGAAYGGPVMVALIQATALRRQGHSAIAAGDQDASPLVLRRAYWTAAGRKHRVVRALIATVAACA